MPCPFLCLMKYDMGKNIGNAKKERFIQRQFL